MKFGVSLHPNWPEGRTQEAVLRRCVDDIVTAEKLGVYDTAFVTEHHFASDPTYKPLGREGKWPAYDLISDPLCFLMYAAARTETIKLGTAVLVLHYEDPIRVAEKAAMIDLLSGGRLQLGLGRGGGVKEPKAFKVPSDPKDNTDKFFEAIDVMMKAWTGKPFKHEGKFFQYPEVILVPVPERQIPIYLSNRNERSVVYAAEHNMSYMSVTGAWGGAGVESHNQYHDLFVEKQTAAGYDPSDKDFPQALYCFIAPDQQEAEDMAYESIQRRDTFAEAHYESRRATGGNYSPLDVPYAHRAKTLDFDVQFKGQVETNLIGTPKNCAEKLKALKEKMPSANFTILLQGVGCPPVEFDRRSMRLFAEEVYPLVKDL